MELGPDCEVGGSVDLGPAFGVSVSCSVGTTSSQFNMFFDFSGRSRFVTVVGPNSVSLKTSRLHLHQTMQFLIRLL